MQQGHQGPAARAGRAGAGVGAARGAGAGGLGRHERRHAGAPMRPPARPARACRRLALPAPELLASCRDPSASPSHVLVVACLRPRLIDVRCVPVAKAGGLGERSRGRAREEASGRAREGAERRVRGQGLRGYQELIANLVPLTATARSKDLVPYMAVRAAGSARPTRVLLGFPSEHAWTLTSNYSGSLPDALLRIVRSVCRTVHRGPAGQAP